jgi:hypothetical protein
MHTNPQMERILPTRLRHILVGANTGGLESLGRQLLVLVRDEVSAEGELVDGGTFTTEIVDADLSSHISKTRSPQSNEQALTLGSGTPRLYLDLGYGLFLQ